MKLNERIRAFFRIDNEGPSRPTHRRRVSRPESLEPRCLLAADIAPIEVGIVYIESDDGTDNRPDEFFVAFRGGAPGTQLTEIRVNTDADLDGLSRGDLFFDTAPGDLGIHNSHSPAVISDVQSIDPSLTPIQVDDGGTLLVMQLQGVTAEETLHFTVDVDEAQRLQPLTFVDAIASGAEFNFSIFEFRFEAPGFYATVSGSDFGTLPRFFDSYGGDSTITALGLPAYESAPTRNAAASAIVQQEPLPVSISGTVWLDENLDLVRGGSESRLSDVTLSLYQRDDTTGAYVDTGHRALTADDGTYTFGTELDLKPGTYEVRETQPGGLFSVGAVVGTVAGQAVGSVATTDVLTGITIATGGTAARNYDFAEASPASLSGYVYVDSSDDGVRNAGETPLANVPVRLEAIDSLVPVSRPIQLTGPDGSYRFDGLPPGTYRVVEVNQPSGYFDGIDTAGTVSGVRVGTAGNELIDNIRLQGGQAGLEYNFGELPPGSISGFVYYSRRGETCHPFTGDTAQNETPEAPLADVVIELRDGQGNLFTTQTNSRGFYQFTGLPKGEYSITEITPAGVLSGTAYVGSIDGVTVGTAEGGQRITNVVLGAGDDSVLDNFCNGRPAEISGHVYHDRSNDGVRDADEEPIAGATVILRNATGAEVARVQTNNDGEYLFTGLLPGEYTLEEITPAPFLDGRDRAGTVSGEARGVARNPGDSITNISLRQGEAGVDYDFGELLGATLSGFVHVETDEDCIRDPGETVLEGVTIRLFNEAGTEVGVTQTDSSGQYVFTNLPPGRYTVVEEQPTGYFNGGEVAGSTGGTTAENRIAAIPVASGDHSVENNFCENPPGELSGYVFTERDGDCLREPGDAGIADVRVELYSPSGQLLQTTVTDSAGFYRFDGLERGEYVVREVQPGGWYHGGQRAGSHGGDDSRADTIAAVVVPVGGKLVEYNFCELEPGSLAGTVFVDVNDDCVHQAGEQPLAGVRIELRDASGNLVTQTVTDVAGNYSFSGLRPGEYQVVEFQPAGYFHGGQRAGSAGGDDTIADVISQITIGAGVTATDYDFCEHEPASLAGNVYVDLDQDCIRDANEWGLADTRVDLYDAADNLVASTTTNTDGSYEFTGLHSGTYRVVEHQPEGFYHGSQQAGSAGGDDSLADVVSAVFLRSGVDAVGYDFCEVLGASLSGYVWSETDLDGSRDATDLPLQSVTVELLDVGGSVIQTTQTDADGAYEFANLRPGTYAVRERQPSGLFHGGQIAGSDGGDASRVDEIDAIILTPGAAAIEYNFYEFPPATISGYVFQDGSAIATSDAIDPRELRAYRDGQRTADDTPLSGVTLELRSVAGQPLDASRAMPGTYPSGPIQTVTDGDGYYEFRGLRPGTFHVYQVQPEGFQDGIDTAGSTGGFAVNAADQPDLQTQILLLTLAADEAADPRNDAIVMIGLQAGQHSKDNNFSEIVTTELPPNFEPPQDPPPQVTPPPNDVFSSDSLVLYFPVVDDALPMPLYSTSHRFTWHLSVINGGRPRGLMPDSEPPELYRRASVVLDAVGWQKLQHNSGQWRMFDADGVPLTFSESFVIGDHDAIAVTGDFDGDGVDQAGIFIAGHWFLDLNGNGRWDDEDLWLHLGSQMDFPVVGDWDGDGKDDIGIFGPEWHRDPQAILHDPGLPKPVNARTARPKNTPPIVPEATNGERLLRVGREGSLRADLIDHVFRYGGEGDRPVAGDLNGDGIDSIGVFRGGRWMLDRDGDGRWTNNDLYFEYGEPGDEPVIGDWDGDGVDDLGVRRGNLWIIDSDGNRKLTDSDTRIHDRGPAESQPVAGDWNGDGRDTPGTYATGDEATAEPEPDEGSQAA